MLGRWGWKNPRPPHQQNQMPRRRKTEELPFDEATATMDPEINDSTTDEMTTEAPEAPELEKEIIKGERLTGDALMAKCRELDSEEITEDEVARACGYFTDTYVNGELESSRIAIKQFWLAFSAAQGIKFAPKKRGGGGAGRPKQPYVKVAKETCKISIGGHFSEAAGFAEHQKVKVTAAPGVITITPWEEAEEVEEDEDF